MTTVGYPDITEDFGGSLNPRHVIACLYIAGYAEVPEWSNDLATRLVRVDGHDTVTIPLNPNRPNFGKHMRDALVKIREVVELGDLTRAALTELGVPCRPQLTSQFVVGGQP